MNLNHILSTTIIGTIATLAIVQPYPVLAKTPEQISQIAKQVAVKIDGGDLGTGVIINRKGNVYTVLTNCHVVCDQKGQQTITTSDGQIYVIDSNSIKQVENLDLAILNFSSDRNYPLVEIGDSNQLQEGTNIYIGGYPKRKRPKINRSYQFTEGYLSGIETAAENGYQLVYTNPTRQGMSGSPILDSEGQLVGIHGRTEGNKGIGKKKGFKYGIPIQEFLSWWNPNDF